VLRIRVGWEQQQEHDINRLVVDGLECDRSLGAGEDPERFFYRANARVRNRNAATHTGRPERLAREKRLAELISIKSEARGGTRRQILQKTRLVGRSQPDQNIIRNKEISNLHGE
jgi:hypothetical protein